MAIKAVKLLSTAAAIATASSLFIFLCLCVCAHVCVSMGMNVTAGIWWSEDSLSGQSLPLSTLFETGPLTVGCREHHTSWPLLLISAQEP